MALKNPEQLKLLSKHDGRSNKYGNKRTRVCCFTFDSKAEAARFILLRSREKDKAISDLQVHPVFELAAGVKYVADFSYRDYYKRPVVEDVKGLLTQAFKIKAKLFKDKHKTEISIIKMNPEQVAKLLTLQNSFKCKEHDV